MKVCKLVGLLVVLATALMALAATAGATTVTTGGTAAATTIEATNESNLTLTSSGLEVTCTHSATKGSISSQGTGTTAKGSFTAVTISGCTQHVTVNIKLGTWEYHWTTGSNGTLTVTITFEIDFTTIFGTVHCNYAPSNTDFGTVTGAANHSTAKATLDTNAVDIPVEAGSNGLCGATAKWTGSYVFNAPVGMTIDQN